MKNAIDKQFAEEQLLKLEKTTDYVLQGVMKLSDIHPKEILPKWFSQWREVMDRRRSFYQNIINK